MTILLSAWSLMFAIGTAADPAFARMRQSAEPLTSLSVFLDKYIGECNQTIGAECKNQAAQFRTRTQGKSFVLTLTDDAVNMVSLGRFETSKREFEIRITPFFGGGGYALTHGAPRNSDSQGNPLVPLLIAHAQLGEEWSPERFQRLFSSHQVRLEVVFQPRSVWTLSGKKGAKSHGVAARLQGIQVVESRSGELLATWLPR